MDGLPLVAVWAVALLTAGGLLAWRGPAWAFAAGLRLLPMLLGFRRRRIGPATGWPSLVSPRRGGGTGPTLVVLHGFGVRKETMAPLAARLRTGGGVVLPDLPGFGEHPLNGPLRSLLEASRSPERPTLERAMAAAAGPAAFAYVDAIADWIGEAFESPVDLLGASMGGAIASLVAARRPDRVRSLVLLGPAGVAPPRRNAFMAAAAEGRNLLEIRTIADLDRVLSLNFVRVPRIPRPIRGALAADLAARQASHDLLLEALAPLLVGGVEAELARIRCPVLVLWGACDEILDPSGAEVFRRELPQATVELLSDAGHTLHGDRPVEVATRIAAFLREARGGGLDAMRDRATV